MIKVHHEEIKDAGLAFIYHSPIYERAAINECDCIVHNSILWGKKKNEKELREIAKKYRLTDCFVIVFVVSDEESKYRLPQNLIVLRTSLRASQKKENELVLPYVWEHVAEPFPPFVAAGKPQVGFCGLVNSHREGIIQTFRQDSRVNANFIIRDQFWGGNPHNADIVNDFNNNLNGNAFIICQRGAGNFSMRFYQTLAAGRIPVLVNTDMVLPFDRKISWQNHIIFEKDATSCVEKVVEVFESGRYTTMQQSCAQLFNSYFSDTIFFQQVVSELVSIIARPSRIRFRPSFKSLFRGSR